MIKSTLNTIDTAVKKLVTPTALMVAAAILSKGLKQQHGDETIIIISMWLLIIWSFGFMVASGFQALKEFEDSGINIYWRFLISTSFALIYLILFVVAVFLALGKLSA